MAEFVRVGVGCEVDISVNLESWDKIPLGYDRDAFPLFTDGFLQHSKGDDDWIFEFLPLGHDLIHDGKRDDNMRLLAALPIDGMADLKFLYPAFPIGSPVRIRITRVVAERIARRCDITIPPAPTPPTKLVLRPDWDPESRTLSVGDTACRKFKRHAHNQIKILEALQAEGWPEKSIANPFSNEAQLHQTIKDFNDSLNKGCRFRLVQDHNRVGWTLEQSTGELPQFPATPG
jgi:hypothetical protein